MKNRDLHPEEAGPGVGLSGCTAQLPPQRLVEALANIRGKLEEFSVAIEFDGLPGGVEHRVAMMTLIEVDLDRLAQFRVQVTVQVVRDFADRFAAVH